MITSTAQIVPSAGELLALHGQPHRLARIALAVRRQWLSDVVRLRASIVHPRPESTAVARRGDLLSFSQWPAPSILEPWDEALVEIDAGDPSKRRQFVDYLFDFGRQAPVHVSLAPWSRVASGLHALWCIAVARIVLPSHHAVVARHDLIGIRLAQVALGFGADTVAGPVEPDRALPLAGITRPNETTLAGLATLVRQAGFIPELQRGEPS